MRRCSKCHKIKPLELFYKDRTKSYGYGNRCKPCQAIYTKAYMETHKEKMKAWKAKYYQEHKEEYKARAKKYNEKH